MGDSLRHVQSLGLLCRRSSPRSCRSPRRLTYGFSRQHFYRLLKRYREGGLEAVDPRSRRPASNPRATARRSIVAIVPCG